MGNIDTVKQIYEAFGAETFRRSSTNWTRTSSGTLKFPRPAFHGYSRGAALLTSRPSSRAWHPSRSSASSRTRSSRKGIKSLR